ncbi:MAG: YciI family protein [Actinomycetales bacterium]
MPNFVVTYRYGAGSAAGRDTNRPAHVDFLTGQFEAKRLLVSGPFGPDEDPGAVLVWNAASKEELLPLINQDPFHANGLIADRDVRQWNVAFGALRGH